MAWSAWTNISATDYMDITFISQANDNILHVRELIMEHLRRTPQYEFIDTSAGYQTQPLPDYLNVVERNLNYLQAEITWAVKRQEGRTWLGEFDDNPTFKYSDVNRWFSDLLVMKLALDSIPERWRVCGTFSCSNHYITQLIRR